MKLKTNDQVKIITGKDSGKTGKIIQVFVRANKVVVEGVNKIKKHLRAGKKNEKGQVIELSAPISASNVMLVCPKCSRAIRVGRKSEAKVNKRYCRKCGEFVD